MKTTLGIAAFTTLALSTIASAGKPTWDEKVLDEVLSNKPLIEKYGTVGYPLADEIDRGLTCKTSTTLYKLNVPLYSQSVAGVPFTAGVGGDIKLVADGTKVGAQLALGPTVELFNSTQRPVDVTFSALTKNDGTNSLDFTVNAFGYTLTTYTLASSATPIAKSEQFGYQLPASTMVNSIGDSYNCPVGCDIWTWEARATLVGHVGGLLSFAAAPTGVEGHAVLSAVSWGDLSLTAAAYSGDKRLGSISATGRLDVMRILFGARAQMLPQSGGNWVAGAASSLWLTNTMGAFVQVDVPLIGKETLFDLTPLDYQKDREFSCEFTNKMAPKKKS